MSNVYIYDLAFIILYMLNKGLGCRFKRLRSEWLPEFSGYFFWAEIVLLVLYLYMRPDHTDSENLVSFSMMLITVGIWVYIVLKNKNT